MKNLLINTDEIVKLIDLKTNIWNYPSSTNCYAYALGLDIPYSKIGKHAYRVGCFSEDELKKQNINVYSLNVEEALIYDLDCLGLTHEEVEPDYKIQLKDIENNFLISFFIGDDDFHFLRKNNYDNFWYHKKGYLDFPRGRDDDGRIIQNPKDAFFIYYDYVKTYKLGFKNKEKKHEL